jgi:hypothetical protein
MVYLEADLLHLPRYTETFICNVPLVPLVSGVINGLGYRTRLGKSHPR